jgi:hypothetical protein
MKSRLLSQQKVPVYLHRALALGIVPLLLFAGPALSGDGVALNITNDGIEDIFVTVYDMNTNPYTTVVEHERINGFTKVPISATADAMGRANLSWAAISVDDRDRKCGQGARIGLDYDTLVSVHVDSMCAVGRRGR